MQIHEDGKEVAKLSDIPVGKMKHVRAFEEVILLSNVNGTIYATQNRCGHQNASLAKGTLNGHVVSCPLHAATFDVRTGKNLTGPQLMMSSEMMQKLPQEMIAMFKKTGEILSEIEVQPLKTFLVDVKGDSIFVSRPE
jgi:nitrite reductase/ring-hydroxylating ferredoxin subunit